MVNRHVPGNPAPDRIADDRRPLDAELVHQYKDQGDGACVGIVAGRVRRREAGAGQVEPHDAVVRLQRLGPGLERVQAGAEAVQQDDRRRVLRPVIAHMQLRARHRQHVARLPEIGLLQNSARLVRRVQPAAAEQHRRQRHAEKDRSQFQHRLASYPPQDIAQRSGIAKVQPVIAERQRLIPRRQTTI